MLRLRNSLGQQFSAGCLWPSCLPGSVSRLLCRRFGVRVEWHLR